VATRVLADTSGVPTWLAVLGAGAAALIAVGIIFSRVRKMVKAIVVFAADWHEMVPMVRNLTATFGGNPQALSVLNAIAREFQADSGSTLRDVVNRLETAAQDSKVAADALKVGVATAKELAQRDRDDYKDILRRLDRMADRVDAGNVESAADRLKIADEAEVDRHKIADVADELAASRRRAEAVDPDEPPGTAADAAARGEGKP
jgi:hypothetical protein